MEESTINLSKLIGVALLAAWFVFKRGIRSRMQYSKENNNYFKSTRKRNREKRCTQSSLLVPSHSQQAEPYAHNEPLNVFCRSPYTNGDQGFPSCLISNRRREDNICSRSYWAIKPRHSGSRIRSAGGKEAKL